MDGNSGHVAVVESPVQWAVKKCNKMLIFLTHFVKIVCFKCSAQKLVFGNNRNCTLSSDMSDVCVYNNPVYTITVCIQ